MPYEKAFPEGANMKPPRGLIYPWRCPSSIFTPPETEFFSIQFTNSLDGEGKTMKTKISILLCVAVLMYSCIIASNVIAGTINLPKTGQTKCYDLAGAEIPCVGTGQDGEIRAGVTWPEPRFIDNEDGTVTDRLTGLMWTQDAGTPTIGSCTGGAMNWQQALYYVACLNSNNYLGHHDWRLGMCQ